MHETFDDKNATLMRSLAKTIKAEIPHASEHSISSQFFGQPEINIQSLDTTTLLDAMGGGADGKRARFKEAMRAQYPTRPEMWNVPMPEAAESPAGGKSDRFRSAGKALADALERNRAAKALKAAVDGGSGGLYAEAFANARRVQATW
ncbi:MAG TPA: hypothetical protein VK302_10605 [Terriglobales bacterium]|nr:hypothetical protein [Terriglobales bacterium]